MKNKKKKLKHDVEGFLKSDKFLTVDPKDFMSEGEINFEKKYAYIRIIYSICR